MFCYQLIKSLYQDNSTYYESYFKSLTDTLNIALVEMRYIENVSKINDDELSFHLGVITGCHKYLLSIEPPDKYKFKHEEILDNLYHFVEQNKR